MPVEFLHIVCLSSNVFVLWLRLANGFGYLDRDAPSERS